MQALILAAGRGSRLGDSGHEVPKCLLEIGRRRLIEHQIEALADAGVGPVHVVVGYGAEEIREIVGMRAEYVVNTRWEQTNSLYSFWLARDAVQDEVLVLNCDVLFAPEIVGRLLDHPGDAFAIDSASGAGREQMKVRTHDGRLVEMSKELPPEQSSGENVGILKLTAETTALAFERAGRLVEAGQEKEWVGAAVNEVARECELHPVDIAGLPWIEIDFAADLARARKEVWPAIAGGAYRRRPLLKAAAWVLGAGLLAGALYAGQFMSRPPAEALAEWENLEIDNLEPLRISLGEYSQDWWVLGRGEVADVGVDAGGRLRIESRLLDPAGDREPYVLEVLVDGERLDWFKETTRPSGKATHADRIVGHKERFYVDVPEGARRLQIRMIAPAAGECLVRVRRLIADVDE